MKKKKFLFVLLPVLAFMLVACGGLFDGDEIIEEDPVLDMQQDDFIIEPEQDPTFEDEAPAPDPMQEEYDDGAMEMEEPEVIYEVE